MSSDQPYNSLGQILSEGGEIALGLAIHRGWSDSQISALFARRFEPMQPADRARLIEIAKAGLAGAESLSNLDPSDTIPLGSVPIVPELFGDDFSGKRYSYVGEWFNPNTGKWIEVRGDFPSVPSPEDIATDIGDKANTRIKKSPEKFGLPGGTQFDDLEIRITTHYRKF